MQDSVPDGHRRSMRSSTELTREARVLAKMARTHRGRHVRRRNYVMPAFCANQLGRSAEMFLHTYAARWINRERNVLEMKRFEVVTKTQNSVIY